MDEDTEFSALATLFLLAVLMVLGASPSIW